MTSKHTYIHTHSLTHRALNVNLFKHHHTVVYDRHGMKQQQLHIYLKLIFMIVYICFSVWKASPWRSCLPLLSSRSVTICSRLDTLHSQSTGVSTSECDDGWVNLLIKFEARCLQELRASDSRLHNNWDDWIIFSLCLKNFLSSKSLSPDEICWCLSCRDPGYWANTEWSQQVVFG